MEFLSQTAFNIVHWITSLDESERGTTARTLEDLKPMFGQIGLKVVLHRPTTAAQFLYDLGEIAYLGAFGLKPIVHLDMHGSKDGGIAIQASGESIGWPQLADSFRAINAATGCNLSVISGACFSFHAVTAVDITRMAPFYQMLAPEDEITAGELEANTVGFYRDLLSGIDIFEASAMRFGDRVRIFHCEEMLANVLRDFLDEAAVGKQKRRRIEDYITRVVTAGVEANPDTLKQLREMASTFVEPTEELLVRHGAPFLGGRRPSFTIAELKAEVLKGRQEGVRPTGRYA